MDYIWSHPPTPPIMWTWHKKTRSLNKIIFYDQNEKITETLEICFLFIMQFFFHYASTLLLGNLELVTHQRLAMFLHLVRKLILFEKLLFLVSETLDIFATWIKVFIVIRWGKKHLSILKSLKAKKGRPLGCNEPWINKYQLFCALFWWNCP